jgi:putative SOS response-associated peptidase YedK
MCGRMTMTAEPRAVADEFGVEALASGSDAVLVKRYNIAPTQPVAVVRASPERRELVALKWGVVPAGEKEPGPPIINARAESAASRAPFRDAFRARRCLVPADGFYEWQGKGKKKQAFFIHLGGKLFAFAGLWDGDAFCILTTAPNEVVRPIHDRMPVILRREDYARWLDPALRDPRVLQDLLRPFDARAMRAHPVAAWVNDVNNDGAHLVEPGGQQVLGL